MNKTANLYARIEPDVKEQAESVLETLGISVSSAINEVAQGSRKRCQMVKRTPRCGTREGL